MAKRKEKVSKSPLANIAAENLDRAAGEIAGTIAALKHVQDTGAETACEHLREVQRLIAEARELAIEAFEHNP